MNVEQRKAMLGIRSILRNLSQELRDCVDGKTPESDLVIKAQGALEQFEAAVRGCEPPRMTEAQRAAMERAKLAMDAGTLMVMQAYGDMVAVVDEICGQALAL